MLTATYSMVAISVEQKSTRSILSKLQRQIETSLQDLQNINQVCIESALKKLVQLEEFCHRRKVEMYVIPAIRKSTREADPLLAELDSLSQSGGSFFRSLQEQLQGAIAQGALEINKLCSTLDLYCRTLLTRLAKEEDELLPMVRKLLSVDEWFGLASKFLSDDAKYGAHKRLAADRSDANTPAAHE